MKGDEEDCVARTFLQLGSKSSSGLEAVRSNSGMREEDGYSLSMGMLSHLSRNGLSMLAKGVSNGGFSLKPLAVGIPSLRNLASNGASERASAVSGGGFTGFTEYGAAKVVPKTTRLAFSPMSLRFEGQEETQVIEEAGASSSHRGSIGDKGDEQRDVQKLTTDECWRLILKLGTQWPTWNGVATPSQATGQQGMTNENDLTFEGSNHGHPSNDEERMQGKEKPGTPQRPQDFLKLLATRALEALAQTPPDSYGKTSRSSMLLAPKQTTKGVMDSKAAGEGLETPTEVPEPTPVAKAPSSSLEMLAPKTTSSRPRTAALTIFYDGVVNVCDNIPADKARLIMMFAEKAGVSLNAQALLRNVKYVTPSRQPSTASEQMDLQHSKLSSLTRTSSAPSDLPSPATHVEGSSSDIQDPAECSNSANMAISEPSAMPLMITMINTQGNSRHHVTVKPLPNARKNSLARFLDSRKRSRGTASCSEGGSPKKQALGDGCCPSDSDQDLNDSEMSSMPNSGSQYFDSKKKGICANCHKASGRTTSDAEMTDSLVE
ncbi:hypothetical protein M758_7G075400 [Ceratodon purpureus]|nr:hypothetical protein M758_7G075400 [Ceratodon purpureus]